MFNKESKHSLNLLRFYFFKWQKRFRHFSLLFCITQIGNVLFTHSDFLRLYFFFSKSIFKLKKGWKNLTFSNSEFGFVILQKSNLKYSKHRIPQINRITVASSWLVIKTPNSVCTFLLQKLFLLGKKLGWLILNVHCNSIWIDYLSNISNSISLQDPSSFKDDFPYFSKPPWYILLSSVFSS